MVMGPKVLVPIHTFSQQPLHCRLLRNSEAFFQTARKTRKVSSNREGGKLQRRGRKGSKRVVEKKPEKKAAPGVAKGSTQGQSPSHNEQGGKLLSMLNKNKSAPAAAKDGPTASEISTIAASERVSSSSSTCRCRWRRCGQIYWVCMIACQPFSGAPRTEGER